MNTPEEALHYILKSGDRNKIGLIKELKDYEEQAEKDKREMVNIRSKVRFAAAAGVCCGFMLVYGGVLTWNGDDKVRTIGANFVSASLAGLLGIAAGKGASP